MKHDELLPSRPGRRNWTRAEDYLPPRRLRRAASERMLAAHPARFGPDEQGRERALLGIIPFVLLMMGLGVLGLAVAYAAWPGRQVTTAERPAAPPAARAETLVDLQAPNRR